MSLALWARPLHWTSAQASSGWTYFRSECRDPAEVGPVRRRTLTWQTVLTAIRRVGLPANEVQAPPYTLVNLKTTFYTKSQTVARSLHLVGFDVDVAATPTSYTWHWGDRTTSTSSTPGRPYPSTDVTHTYEHATHGHRILLRVDTIYTAKYRIDGGGWQQIPSRLTIAGPTTRLPVKQAAAVLVAGE